MVAVLLLSVFHSVQVPMLLSGRQPDDIQVLKLASLVHANEAGPCVIVVDPPFELLQLKFFLFGLGKLFELET